MQAEAYTLTAEQLAAYLKDAIWPYWIVEMPHRILCANPATGLAANESLSVHCLSGRGFGPDGEFRWWRGEAAEEIHATLITDGETVAGPADVAPTSWERDGEVDAACRTIFVWGKRENAECSWREASRSLSGDLDPLYESMEDAIGQRALRIRLYTDVTTGELLLWRMVAPAIKSAIGDGGGV